MLMNNSTLDSRLKRYSAFTAAVAATAVAQAQIVWTDVSPDAVVTIGNSFAINMDNTGATEFTIEQNSSTSFFNAVYNEILQNGSASNAEVAIYTSTFFSGYGVAYIASAFSAGQSIGSSLSFIPYSVSSPVMAAYGTMSTTSGGTYALSFGASGTRFLGVRFDIGGNTHYGWIRVTTPSFPDQITVHDYAYNSVADQPIQAGAGVGIDESLAGQVSVINQNNELNINFGQLNGNKQIDVINITGQTLLTARTSNSYTTMQLDGIASGVYLVNIYHAGEMATQKIYVK